MKLSFYLWMFIICITLSSCMNNNISNTTGGNKNISSSINAIVPIQFQAQQHTATKYYTTTSNTSEYMAFSLKWQGNIRITTIQLENNINNLFEIESNPNVFGINQCQTNQTLSGIHECEIMVHITNPFIVNKSSVTLAVIAGGARYTKTLTKSGGYAYIAGDFTQTYANGKLPALAQESGTGYCGPNGNARCQIIKYDFASNTLSTVATTDYAINDIAVDNSDSLYIGGMFTNFTYHNTTLSNGQPSGVSSLLVKMMPTESGVVAIDWLQSLSSGTPTYPNGAVNAIEFDSTQNQLFFAGGFNSMANYNTNNGFPLLQYNLNTNDGAFINALGDDLSNPDTSVTAIGLDASGNMYLSGFYSQISNFIFNDGYSARTINKCIPVNGVHTCLTGSSYSMSITSQEQYVQPAYNLTFQPDGGLYAAGGFSHMYYAGSSIEEILGSDSGPYLAAFNSDPINSFVNNPTNNWSNPLNSSAPADNVIGVISPYNNGQFYIGGQFSTIGGVAPDANAGECGSNNASSCLLAKFDGSNWSKILTTDGAINVFVIVAGIDVK